MIYIQELKTNMLEIATCHKAVPPVIKKSLLLNSLT